MRNARRALIAAAALLAPWAVAGAGSLFFTSNFAPDDVGRVEIQIDGTPADIGADDFTLEFWMKSALGNDRPEVGCNRQGYNWIEGNIVFDRDRLANGGRDFGLAIAGGVIVFGVENSSGSSYTICGSTNVLDGDWRHVAIERAVSGVLRIYVDGALDAEENGPPGDISYPDGQPPAGRDPLLAIGREKHDLGPPGFTGWIDEIRLSSSLRYNRQAFAPQRVPFALDTETLALYHLDATSGNAVEDEVGTSPGVRRHSAAAGPEWHTDTPMTGVPSAGRIQFSRGTDQAGEGSGAKTFSVTRTGGASGAATVAISVTGGSAASGADYQFTPQTLTWNNGDMEPRPVSVTLVDDSEQEGNETIDFTLSNQTGATLGTPSTMRLTILDNDGTPPPSSGTLQFAAATYSVSEGTATLTIGVTRAGGSSGSAQVSIAVSGGTATSGSDYQYTAEPLDWNDGESDIKTARITILEDTIDEPAETIVLILTNAAGAALGSPSTTTVTIDDNDPAGGGGGGGGGGGSGGGGGGGGALGAVWLAALAGMIMSRRFRGFGSQPVGPVYRRSAASRGLFHKSLIYRFIFTLARWVQLTGRRSAIVTDEGSIAMKIWKTVQAVVAVAGLGLAGTAAATPVTFDLADGPQSSVSITSLSTVCVFGACGATVALNPLLDSLSTTLNPGESWSFNFFSINLYGLGAGSGTLSASLGFDSPTGAPNADGSAAGSFLAAGFLFSAGTLSWTTQPGLFSLADGTSYSVLFEDLAGITLGNSVNVRARLTLNNGPVRVPEPSTIALLGAGLLALGWAVRRRLGQSVKRS